jgi:30S ribosomal protein S31
VNKCYVALKQIKSIKIKNFINFVRIPGIEQKNNQYLINMGKGDRKSRRGKIILGSYGVRRPRKNSFKPAVSAEKVTKEKEIKESKPVREKKASGSSADTKATRVTKPRAAKTTREKKEVSESKVDKTSGKDAPGKA